MITVYGLRNCDTCRMARRWLDARRIPHAFHDVRADGLDSGLLAQWVRQVGWEVLLNRRGTTWRTLDASARGNLDEEKAIRLMAAHPALVKRPVFVAGEVRAVGFDEAAKRDVVAFAGAEAGKP